MGDSIAPGPAPHVGDRGPAGTTANGVTSLFSAAFVIGTFPLLTRLVSPTFGVTSQTFTRFAIAAVTLMFVCETRGKRFRLARRDLLRMSLLGTLTFALGVCMATAATNMEVATVIALLFGTSIVTAAIGGILLGEPMSRVRVATIVIALAGLAMYAHELAGSPVGFIASVAAGLCDGTCNTLRRQVRHVDRTVAVVYQYGIGAFLAGAVMEATNDPVIHAVRLWPLVAMLAYAIASMVLGGLLYRGFAQVHVSIGGVIMASQVFFTTLMGTLLLREVPDSQEVAGALLVFTASVVSVTPARWFGRVRTGSPEIATPQKIPSRTRRIPIRGRTRRQMTRGPAIHP